MFLSEYDEEEVRRLWAEDAREAGRAEGEKVGIQKKAVEDAKKFKEAGVAEETIADCTGLSLEFIRKL